MKYAICLATYAVFSQAYAEHSTLKIPQQACLKAQYGHVVGGTLHSRTVLQKRLYERTVEKLPHSQQEALTVLRQRYPSLEIKDIKFVIRQCEGFYLADNGERRYLFDPIQLTLIKKSGSK